MYDKQISRIKKKLSQTKWYYDLWRKTSGASFHWYFTHRISSRKLAKFEQQHDISLPQDFRCFLIKIGWGAGPHHGIYNIAKRPYDCYDLRSSCLLSPEMSEEEWEHLMEEEEKDDDNCIAFRGLLPIGDQGCANIMMLVLNGKYRGRIVYVEEGEGPGSLFPHFCEYSNFLDWYESWLDEVIAGYDTASFGTRLGGDEQQLLERFATPGYQVRVIESLNKLPQLSDQGINFLIQQLQNESINVYNEALITLVRHAREKARPFVERALSEDQHRLAGAQAISYYYRGDRSWFKALSESLSSPMTEECFGYIFNALREFTEDYSSLVKPFLRHDDEEIRSTALFYSGKVENKHIFYEDYKYNLQYGSEQCQHATLQAMPADTVFLPYCEAILAQYDKDSEIYILTNVLTCLKDIGKPAQSVLEKAATHPDPKISTRAQNILAEIY